MSELFSPDGLWFTADPHFGHRRAAVFRGFEEVGKMDEALVRAWNDRVGPGDTVFLLGDVSFAGPGRTRELLDRLNGRIQLILGNHDKVVQRGDVRDRFDEMVRYKEIRVATGMTHHDRQWVVLMHFALRVWNEHHHGAWHLYGHSHGHLEPVGRSMDVGVDAVDPPLAPVSFDEVRSVLADRPIHVVDHHVPSGDDDGPRA